MHEFFIKLLVCFVAGMGAGVGTGLSGLSAAAIISPMLITFLGIDSYMAVGIALASDVLASAVSAYTYGKNDNLDIKNGRIMLVTVLIFTTIGSYAGTYIPQNTMGSFSLIMTTVLGIKFIFLKSMEWCHKYDWLSNICFDKILAKLTHTAIEGMNISFLKCTEWNCRMTVVVCTAEYYNHISVIIH